MTFTEPINTLPKESTDKQKNCLKQQTTFLAVSYLFFVACDFLMMGLGNALFDPVVDFQCNDSNEVIRKTKEVTFL